MSEQSPPAPTLTAVTQLLADLDKAKAHAASLERQLTAACTAYGLSQRMFGYSIACLRRDLDNNNQPKERATNQ